MLVTLALVACGGSDNHAFEPPGSGGGSSTASSVTVSSSSPTVAADGSSTATITALVKDASNNAVSGATVNFSADKGSLVVGSTTTDSSGTATATLSGSGVSNGSTITVTATSGSVSGNTTVTVANTQQTLALTTSSPQIASDGSTSATITATVLNSGNQVVSGVPVSITANAGALNVTRGTTDATGTAVATLTAPPNDPTNRRITVTATAGSASATVPVDVTGTKLVFTGLGNLVLGNQGTYTATLTNSGGAAISGKTVTFASSNGNTLSTTTATTDSLGQAAVQVTAANSGTDSLTAAALGLTAAQSVSVSNQNFAFTTPAANTNVPLGTPQTITITWLSSGVPQSGKVITFTATRGTLSAQTATTNGSGQASVTISSGNSGPSVIAASSTGVSAQTTIDFIATNPASIVVQASPATIPTQGQSTISAVVRDASNNLVENQTVQFTASDITSGGLTVASAVTDSQGRAQTVFVANSTPSSSNGVTITASIQGSSVTPGTTTLTVGGQSLRITLGTGVHISENDPQKTRFILPYSLTAVDSAGNPVNNRQITLTIHSVQYGKGTWIKAGSIWVQTGDAANANTSATPPVIPAITTCPNEDANLNGILDPGEDSSGQGNNNQVLDPSDVATVDTPTVTTNSSGVADFNVIYPEDRADWVQVRLTATSTVAGSESSTSAVFWLPMLSDYLTAQTPPPGTPSPYGVATSCTNPN